MWPLPKIKTQDNDVRLKQASVQSQAEFKKLRKHLSETKNELQQHH